MALRLIISSVFSISGAYGANRIQCPILDCGQTALDALVPGTCFEHDSSVPTKTIMGKLCYDSQTDVTEPQQYCPFSYLDNEYMWVEETNQNQEASDLKMHDKSLSQI